MTRDEAIAAGEAAYDNAYDVDLVDGGWRDNKDAARKIAFGAVWDAAVKVAPDESSGAADASQKVWTENIADATLAVLARRVSK